MEKFKIDDTVKIKNPSAPYQKGIRYTVKKLFKTVCWLKEVEDGFVYKNVRYSIITKA